MPCWATRRASRFAVAQERLRLRRGDLAQQPRTRQVPLSDARETQGCFLRVDRRTRNTFQTGQRPALCHYQLFSFKDLSADWADKGKPSARGATDLPSRRAVTDG